MKRKSRFQMVRSTNEFLVLPKEDLNNTVLTLTKFSQKKWNPIVKKQFSNKLTKAKETREANTNDPVKVEVHFQNGTVATYLFIPCDYTLFQVHEALRTGFQDTIRVSKNVSFNLNYVTSDFPLTHIELIDALSSLVCLSIWYRPNYETIYKEKPIQKPKYGFYTDVGHDVTSALINKAELKAFATNQVRTLAFLPSNKLDSKNLVEFALQRAKKLKVQSEFIGVQKLRELGAGAFCSVVQTVESSGGIVVLKRHGNKKQIALVGKGITFDTGGLDLKTDSSMLGMHRDMTGAALALSGFEALIKTDKTSSIFCYLAIGENLIGPNSYKPGDVIKSLSGQTIEIENTDAEGRLVLADTLTYADRELQQGALILDFATLTGSAVDVLGPRWSIAMTKREELWPMIISAGRKSGERMFPVPILEEFEDAVTSTSLIADYSQCTNYSHAEHSYAGAFLSSFVNPNKTHLHIDLASEVTDDGLGLVSSEVSGFGVRWLVEFVEMFSKIKTKTRTGVDSK
jgi:leucyl aminopeptidase